MENLSWRTIKNSVSERLINDSLTHTFHDKKIHKRTKFLNSELKKHSGLKSYSQYVEIKTAILKKLTVDEKSDFQTSFRTNNPNSTCKSPSLSSYSNDDEYENNQNSNSDTNSTSILFGDKVKVSKKKKNSNKTKRKTSLGTPKSRFNSNSNSNDLIKPARSPVSRASALRKLKSSQSKLTTFLRKKSIAHQESPQKDKQCNTTKNENVPKSSSRKSQMSSQKTSKPEPSSKSKSIIKRDICKTETVKPRNKTREDVKKNLSSIIGNFETKNVAEEDVNKSNLDESQNDSEFNLSNVIAVAQSTQYPDDTDISDQTKKKDDYIQTKDSGISNVNGLDDETLYEETEQHRLDDSYSSENETIKLDHSEYEQNVHQRETNVAKIIGTEIVNKKYKILGKEQENSLIVDEENYEENMENDISDKIEENFDNEEKLQGQWSERKLNEIDVPRENEIITEEFECQNNEDDERNVELFSEEEETGSEVLPKIKKFIIKKPENKKINVQKSVKKKKVDEVDVTKVSEQRAELNNIDKENQQIIEKDRENIDQLLLSIHDQESDQPKKEDNKKLSDQNEDSICSEGSKYEKEQEVIQTEIKHNKTSEKRKLPVEKSQGHSNSKKEDTILRSGVENNDSNDSDSSFEGGKLLIDESKRDESSSEEEEKEETVIRDLNQPEEDSLDSENSTFFENESQVSKEFENHSREVLTQFVHRTDPISEDEEMRLTLENEENAETFVNLDDNKITIDEHKIEISDNMEMNQKVAEDEEIMSAQSLKRVNQIKRLNLTEPDECSSSDEEFFKDKIIKNKEKMKEKSSSDSDDTEEDVKKKSSKKKKTLTEKSPKKEKSKLEDSVKSKTEIQKNTEDVNKMLSKKKKLISSEEKSTIKETKKKLSKETSIQISNEIETEIQNDIEEDDSQKSKKEKKISSEKKKKLNEKTEKKNNSQSENSLKSPQKVSSEDQSEKKDKENSRKRDTSLEEDSDFETYIRDGILFHKQKKETAQVIKKKKSKKEKDEVTEKSKDLDNKKTSSASQIIEEILSTNIESSQIISDPDTQVSMENESRKSKKTKKDVESDALNYALSSLKKKNNRYSCEIDNQNNKNSTDLNKSEDRVEDSKIMTQLDHLIEKENLVEYNLPSSVYVNDISENDEVWLFEIPKKEVSSDWIGKKLSFNGTELKLGNTTYQTTCRKLNTMTCVLSAKKAKRPYKTVHFRPLCSIFVRPKTVVNSLIDENRSDEKVQKSTSLLYTSSSNTSGESISETVSDKKMNKKKKLFSKNSDVKNNTPENNKMNTSHNDLETLESEKKRKYIQLTSDNEDKKSDSKVNVKRKKKWDMNEFALDEKPPVITPKNSVYNNQGRSFNSDSSDVEVTDGETKLKKEKLEQLKKIPLTVTKKRIEISQKKEKKLARKISCSVIRKSSVEKEENSNSSDDMKERKNKKEVSAEDIINKKVKRRKSVNSNVESVSGKLTKQEDILQKVPKKLKKKSEKSVKDLKYNSRELQLNKKEELETSDSSDFEVKDVKKREKKLRKKPRFSEKLYTSEKLKYEDDVKPKEEKHKKKVTKLVDFDH